MGYFCAASFSPKMCISLTSSVIFVSYETLQRNPIVSSCQYYFSPVAHAQYAYPNKYYMCLPQALDRINRPTMTTNSGPECKVRQESVVTRFWWCHRVVECLKAKTLQKSVEQPWLSDYVSQEKRENDCGRTEINVHIYKLTSSSIFWHLAWYLNC